MGLRFRKSITLCKGVRLNLGGQSASVSVGTKGIHQSFSTTGRTTTSIGIPGTGVSYVKSVNLKKGFKDLFKKKDEKDANGKKNASSDNKAKKNAEQEAELQAAKETYEEYVAAIAALKQIHVNADEPVDWKEVLDRPAPSGGLLAGLRSETKKEQEEWQKLHDFAGKILAGDTDAYLEVVSEVRPYDDLLEYGSGFEVGTDDPKLLEVEFQVRSEEVIPEQEYHLDAKGKLKIKELSKSAYYDIVQDYVCSAILRVARDSFALLPVETVIVHATDVQLNTATGMDEERTIVSVKIPREKLQEMNMERIDPSDAVNALGAKMNFKKTSGFSPVARIEP